MNAITATRTTTNPAWTNALKIELVWTGNGYWWQGVAPEGETKDAATDANALRPGGDRRTGYATVVAACRQATKEGWKVVSD
jgi:hypothetical protein